MIIPVLLLILFFVVISAILFFVFYMLLPALKEHAYAIDSMILPFEQVREKRSGDSTAAVQKPVKRAVVLCSPEKENLLARMEYKDIKTCRLFHSMYVTQNDCSAGCIGFGDCMYDCPQQAIIIKNRTAVVTNLCNGCGQCIDRCPMQLIKLIPADTERIVMCAAAENEPTACSQCHVENNCMPPANISFKFWQSCYTLIVTKLWKK